MFVFAAALEGPVTVVLMSAKVWTMAVMTFACAELPLLFPGTGSLVSDVLDTSFVTEPVAGNVTTTVKFVLAALAKFVRVGHVTTPAEWMPPLDALTKLTPAG